MHELHRKAAEEHERAAHAHRTAAEHNEKGENESETGIPSAHSNTPSALMNWQRKPTASPGRSGAYNLCRHDTTTDRIMRIISGRRSCRTPARMAHRSAEEHRGKARSFDGSRAFPAQLWSIPRTPMDAPPISMMGSSCSATKRSPSERMEIWQSKGCPEG